MVGPEVVLKSGDFNDVSALTMGSRPIENHGEFRERPAPPRRIDIKERN